jgi:hypothetical protein
VSVSIPAQHLTATYNANCPGGQPPLGANVLVLFDESKIPWVVAQTQAVARGTVLPSSPEDGQEYDYVADAVNGVVWRLRYRAVSASAHKWEFVGGVPVVTGGSEVHVSASSAFVELKGSPQIKPPLDGDYDVTMDMLMSQQVAGASNIEAAIVTNKVAGSAVLMNLFIATAQFAGAWQERTARFGLLAANSYQIYVRSLSGLSTQYQFGQFSYRPVRVG